MDKNLANEKSVIGILCDMIVNYISIHDSDDAEETTQLDEVK